MVKCPMYGLSSEERRKATKNCAKYLGEELHSLKFEMAIFMGKTTFKLVKGLLKLNFSYCVVPLPFRSVTSFKKGLKKTLAALSINPHGQVLRLLQQHPSV
jgi:hypothetical protein